MPSLARRNLFHDKVRLAVTLTGIVLAVALIPVQPGLYSTAIVLAARLNATFFLVSKGRTSQPGAVAKADAEPTSVVAAPGRVEPILEEIKVSSEIRGKIKSMLVEEDRAKVEADVALARAQLDEARARLEKTSIRTDKPAQAQAQ